MAFKLDSKLVYDATYLKEKQPKYFKGCKTNPIKIIQKKSIPKEHYMFASYSKIDGWKLLDHDSNYKKKKLLISKEWTDANIDVNIDANILPDIVHIHETERFVHLNGKIINLEIRGTLGNLDSMYFCASDVGKMISLKNMINDHARFLPDKHYAYFQDVMYLTYAGLLRLLFSSVDDIAEHFQKWAHSVLLNKTNKNNENNSVQTVRSFLNTGMTSMSAIYMLELGRVKDVRSIFSIPDTFKDDDVLIKFGLTNDLSRRMLEHDKTYGKVCGCDIRIKFHAYIDTMFLYEAEKEISDYFKNVEWDLKHDKYKELVCVPEIMLNNVVQKHFKSISTKYCSKIQELQVQLQRNKMALEEKENAHKYMREIMQAKDDKIEVLGEMIDMLKSTVSR